MTPLLFLADVDGTLIRTGMPLLPKVKEAAARFRRAGGLLALCTGRAHLSAREIAAELNITLPCVLFGGAALYDFAAGKAVRTTPLPADTRDVIVRLADSCPGLSIQAYTTRRAYLLRTNDVLQERGIREELEPALSRLEDVRGEIVKLVLTHPDPEELRRRAAACFDDRHDFAFSSARFAEVVARGADKGGGAKLLAERLRVPLSRVLSAGDAMTDLALFGMSACSFAPANASEPVRRRADVVVPSCDEGGMAEAFDYAVRLMEEKSACQE